MEGDLTENYATKIDGYKRYKCELCDYMASQKKDMSDHLLRKKHRENYKNKQNVIIPATAPIQIIQPINENINLVINSITGSPPKTKLKGKTFLSTNCADSIKIDTTLPYLDHYARTLNITEQDISKWRTSDTNQLILHYFNNIIKKIGINDFPIRCVDKSRKRFYYNDLNVGWTEDILNEQTLKFVRHIIGNINLTAINLYHSNDLDIKLEMLNEIIMKHTFWSLPCDSLEETINKSQKKADHEKSECLYVLSEILKVDDE